MKKWLLFHSLHFQYFKQKKNRKTYIHLGNENKRNTLLHDKFQVPIIRANSTTPVMRNPATKKIHTGWLTGVFRTSTSLQYKIRCQFIGKRWTQYRTNQLVKSQIYWVPLDIFKHCFQTWDVFPFFYSSESILAKNKNYSVGMFTYQSRKKELCA